MPRVIHFEISADDPVRAIGFYSNVFGWQIKKWEGPREYWIVQTGPEGEPGIDGGLFRRKGHVNYVNTIDVSSLEEAARRVLENGGKIVVPKIVVPEVGYLSYCQDTEGNVFGVMEKDATARIEET